MAPRSVVSASSSVNQETAIHMAVLQYRLYIDPVQSDGLEKVEQIDRGWTAPLPRMLLAYISHLVLARHSIG